VHSQLVEILDEFRQRRVQAILLKGAGLIELFPEYMREREMEDIDLLVKPGQLKQAKDALVSLGYTKAEKDPYAFSRKGSPFSVDLCPGIWYLDSRENDSLWLNALNVMDSGAQPPALVLSPADFYIHILAHASIHHKKFDSRWQKDLELLKSKYPEELTPSALETKIKSYGIRLPLDFNESAQSGTPYAGHVSRFWFLPLRKKILYSAEAFFPPSEFLADRYGLRNTRELALMRLIRPFLLVLHVWEFVVARFAYRYIKIAHK